MSAGFNKFLALVLVTTCAGYTMIARADFAADIKKAAAEAAEAQAKQAKVLTAAEVKKWDEAVAREVKKVDEHQKKWDAAQKKILEAREAVERAKIAADKQAAEMKATDAEFAALKKDLGPTLASRFVPDNVKTQLRQSVTDAEKEAKRVREEHAKAAKAVVDAQGLVTAADKAAAPIGEDLNKANREIGAFYEKTIAARGGAAQADADAAKRVAEAKAVAEKKAEADLKSTRQAIALADLKAELSTVKTDITDMDVKRAMNEEALNHSRVGEFVQAKLEGMMLQDGFCSGVKNCTQGKAERINFDSLFKSNAIDRNKAIPQGTHDRDGSTKK